MTKKKIFTFIVFVCGLILKLSNVYACSWCKNWNLKTWQGASQNDSVGDQKKIEEFLSKLKKVDNLKKGEEDNLFKEELEKYIFEEGTGVAGKKFYREYLLKYYPRAAVAEDYFYKMCPVALDAALSEIVDVLSRNEWFYYQNKPEGFKSGEYWEITLNQCYRYSSFLSSAMVNEKNKVVPKEGSSFHLGMHGFGVSGAKEGLLIPLLDYFNFHGKTSHFCFYAEYADRLVKMFNEGIGNFELAKVYKYNRFFQNSLEKLRGFSDCPMYEESAKTQKELIELLRHNLGFGIKAVPVR